MRHEDVLEGAGYRFEMNSLTLEIDDGGRGLNGGVIKNARVLHEYDHLVRMLGTSYGMLRYSMSSLSLHYFLECFHLLESVEPLQRDLQAISAKIPGRMTSDQFHSVYFDQQGLGSLYRLQSCRGAIRLLDGNITGNFRVGDLAAWSEMLMRLAGLGSPSEQEINLWLQRLWGFKPPRTQLTYLDGRAVNVRDLLEYLGIVVEMAYRVQYAQGDQEFPQDLVPKPYLQILNAVRHQLPGAIMPEKGLMAQELECLIELALWVPAWPGMSIDDLPAHAVHLIPSYRFHDILEACRSINYEFSFDLGPTDVLEISPRCKALQEAICSFLGWKTPWEIASRWVGALDSWIGRDGESWCKHYFHHPRSQRTSWSRQLLMECGSDPVSGAMLAGSRHYGRIGFPAMLFSSNAEQGYIPNRDAQWPEEDTDFRRMDVLLFMASTYATSATDWRWLSKVVQDESMDTWRRTPLGVDQ